MRIVFDIDGTISFDGISIDPKIKKLLYEQMRLGHELVFATARSYRDSVNILGDPLNKNRIIALNGGAVYYQGKCVQAHELDADSFKAMIDTCHQLDIPYFVDDWMNYATFISDKNSFYQLRRS